MNVNIIKISDLANQLGISIRTLNRWHALRRGPCRIKVGRLIGYRPESVEAWLRQNEVLSVADDIQSQ